MLLHGYGNVFERTLGAGEKSSSSQAGFLYKDSSVTMRPSSSMFRTGLIRHGDVRSQR